MEHDLVQILPARAAGTRDHNTESPAEGGAMGTFGRSFYIETFGCQMNVHDSEKVAGVLMGRGLAAVDDPEQADIILYNTCSIREKAAQKVFSRLGAFKKSNGDKLIGVLGCVAQQEGERFFERAPQVGLVCGSASYSRLPELLDQLRAGNRRVTGLDLDTDESFETELTRRDNPYRAYLTIIEGCDKACSYCVVPHDAGSGTQPHRRIAFSKSAGALRMRGTPRFSCSDRQ